MPGKLHLHFSIPNPDACLKIAQESPLPMPSHINIFLIQGEESGNLRLHKDQVHSLRSVLPMWLMAGSPTLTFHLLLRSPRVAGSTGHADVVPVDVLEKHFSVPPRQGTGLRETKV